MIKSAEQFGIISTWSNGYDGLESSGVVRWLCYYKELLDLRLETQRFAEREARLRDIFEDRKMPSPSIVLEHGLDSLSPKLLKVFAVYHPLVEDDMIRPIPGLSIYPVTHEMVENELIARVMRIGSYSIRDIYGSVTQPEWLRE